MNTDRLYIDMSISRHAVQMARFAAQNIAEAEEYRAMGDNDSFEWHMGRAAAYKLAADDMNEIMNRALYLNETVTDYRGEQ